MEYIFRKALLAEQDLVWEILKGGIERRKAEGSNQWQDGYPNPDVVRRDIENGHGYVLMDGDTVAGYCAIMINNEPAYANIEGKWLTDGDFVVYHRVAVSDKYLGKGLAQVMLNQIEAFARQHHIKSLKADTNFDNGGMLKIFEKLGYVYCGEVVFRDAPRKAFEKVLED